MLQKIVFLLALTNVSAFYVPGVAPYEFREGDLVEIKAVKMTSVRTQIPYDYYTLPFCEPVSKHYVIENLGEILRGDRIVNTPYQFKINVSSPCTILCAKKTIAEKESNLFKERIENDYLVHMIIDNLPAAAKYIFGDGKIQFVHGWQLGKSMNNNIFLNNHLKFVISYNKDTEKNVFRIVGFEVYPSSMSNVIVLENNQCKLPSTVEPLLLSKNGGADVLFTYELSWVSSDVHWTSRWDVYLQARNGQIHWFAIINSVVIVMFLSGILAMIMVRTLRRDIANYNKDDDIEETLEETGWKLVHGDVFRPPRYSMLLCALIGSGVQLFCMILVTIVFAMLGVLSPASQGSLMSAIIFLYVFMGVIAGYYSGRLYKSLKGNQWKRAALLTGLLYPGFVCAISFFFNLFLWAKNSSAAVPFTTMLALICLWFGISIPLVFLGYFFGYRKAPFSQPVRTNQIPRQIPDQMWYMHPFVGMIVAGILPFGAVFIELFFILSALWDNQFYYLFGFLFLVFVIVCFCCSEIAVVMIYFQLCEENYNWWWRSFLMSGSCALYVFCYFVYYFLTKLDIVSFFSGLMYFGYSIVIAFSFWIITGTVGFFATYIFIRNIYSSVKID
ncbi:transmembrane 9 superfamily member 4 isoform X2 [Hydra vulgaris]|uniref:Transmembrane 9 superfamily member n=1 Tax=Hydra vulgaris TaxID=6087 RepID=A0ABM4D676_HYDVU